MAPDHCNFVHAPIDSSTLASCLKTPWFANLLADTTLSPISAPELQTEDQLGNAFCTRILNTPDTISACQSFYKAPNASPSSDAALNFGELHRFYLLGGGLCGHDGFCHGGSLCTIMDQAMGALVWSYLGTIPYTKTFGVMFRRPVAAPGAILCRVWLTLVKGRDVWVEGRLEGGDGAVFMTAKAVFGGPKARLWCLIPGWQETGEDEIQPAVKGVDSWLRAKPASPCFFPLRNSSFTSLQFGGTRMWVLRYYIDEHEILGTMVAPASFKPLLPSDHEPTKGNSQLRL